MRERERALCCSNNSFDLVDVRQKVGSERKNLGRHKISADRGGFVCSK